MISLTEPSRNFGLIVISAPSGAGKSSLCSELLKKYPDRLALSISSTSRSPRGTELEGKEYFFISREDFESRIKSHDFAEWASVHDNYYGTSRKTIESFWLQKKHVLLDIDVQGAESLRNAYPELCFTIFIAPPSLEVLESRLRGRGTETEAAIQKRMANARYEMSHLERFDVQIVNDDFNHAIDHLSVEVERFMNQLEAGKWQKLP